MRVNALNEDLRGLWERVSGLRRADGWGREQAGENLSVGERVGTTGGLEVTDSRLRPLWFDLRIVMF